MCFFLFRKSEHVLKEGIKFIAGTKIVGICVGGLAFIVLMIVIGVICRRRNSDGNNSCGNSPKLEEGRYVP